MLTNVNKWNLIVKCYTYCLIHSILYIATRYNKVTIYWFCSILSHSQRSAQSIISLLKRCSPNILQVERFKDLWDGNVFERTQTNMWRRHELTGFLRAAVSLWRTNRLRLLPHSSFLFLFGELSLDHRRDSPHQIQQGTEGHRHGVTFRDGGRLHLIQHLQTEKKDTLHQQQGQSKD